MKPSTAHSSEAGRWIAQQWPGLLFSIVLAGLVLRVYSAAVCGIVNPDAAVYIQQARAIYYTSWQDLGSGPLTYITPYPALISAANMLFDDWIISARAVSIAFSTLTLIVVYPLARTFFSRDISLLLVLIYSVSPVFVTSGSDVIKDPGAWFFAVFGMLIFVQGLRCPRTLPFMASSLLFVLAAWMRIESLVLIAGSGIYLLFVPDRLRWKRLAWFFAPLLMLAFVAGLAMGYSSRSEMLWSRIDEILPRLKDSLSGYSALRHNLRTLAGNPPLGMPSEYFDQIRSITWLVGLCVILRNAVEAYFIPFFLICIMGLMRAKSALRKDGRGSYFILQLGLMFALIYLFIFSHWVLEQRWLGTAILASFFLMGHGLRVMKSILQVNLKISRRMSPIMLAIIVLAVALPKSLMAREQDKKVFIEISEIIRKNTTIGEEATEILAPESTVRWFSLYVNKRTKGAPDPNRFAYGLNINNAVGADYERFLYYLHSKGISFVLWSAKHWRKDDFDLLSSYQQKDLESLGEWNHPDTGKMILFRVLRAEN